MSSGTLVRRVLLQINADDGDTEEKIDRISAKADELGAKHPDLKVRIETAAASAKVAVLRGELRGLARDEEEAAGGGFLSRIFGMGGSGSGGGGLFGMGSLTAALPLITGGLEAALVEVTGLVSGFAAAGAGAGAFALLAMPAFRKVSGAYSQISADQQAYDRALTKTSRNDALKHLRQDWASLSPAERNAVEGVRSLTGEWGKMSKAFEPAAFEVFSGFLRLAGKLLPDVTPFAKTFATVLSGLLGQAGRFAGSKGFKDWLEQFHKLEGPSVKAIGEGIGRVATSIGNLLTVMSAKDVVNAINIAFSVLAGTIHFTAYAVHNLMVHWDEFVSFMRRTRSDIEDDAHNVAHSFDSIRHGTANLARDSASYFDQMRGNVHRWYSDVAGDGGRVISWFGQLPGRIVHALGDMGSLLTGAGKAVIEGLIRGIEDMAGSAWSAVTNVASGLYHHALSFLGISSPSKKFRYIGQMITQGLAGGITETTAQAVAAAGRLADQVRAAYLSRQITAAEETSLLDRIANAISSRRNRLAKTMQEIGIEMSAGIQAGLANAASASQARSAVSKLVTIVKQAWSGGDISAAQASAMTRWLTADSVRLQALATRRQQILARIKAADTYAANVTSSTESAFGIVSAASAVTPALGVGGILGQLLGDVSQIRTFRANIARLRKMGLNKAYIDQLIQAGPVQGGQIAAELAAASEGDIRQVNAAESQIAGASVSLGRTAANAIYDQGKNMGKGFLSGLEAQQKQISAVMRRVARDMVGEMRRELGLPGGGGRQVIQLEWAGGHGADQEFMTWLKKQIRIRGGNPAVLGR